MREVEDSFRLPAMQESGLSSADVTTSVMELRQLLQAVKESSGGDIGTLGFARQEDLFMCGAGDNEPGVKRSLQEDPETEYKVTRGDGSVTICNANKVTSKFKIDDGGFVSSGIEKDKSGNVIAKFEAAENGSMYSFKRANGDWSPPEKVSAFVKEDGTISMCRHSDMHVIKRFPHGGMTEFDTKQRPVVIKDANGNVFQMTWDDVKFQPKTVEIANFNNERLVFNRKSNPLLEPILDILVAPEAILYDLYKYGKAGKPRYEYEVEANGRDKASTFYIGAGVGVGEGPVQAGLGISAPEQEKYGITMTKDGGLMLTLLPQTAGLEKRLMSHRYYHHLKLDGTREEQKTGAAPRIFKRDGKPVTEGLLPGY